MMFERYYTRKNVGGTEFSFLIGDPVGQLWYDTPPSPRRFSREQAESFEYIPSRTGDCGWAEMKVLRDHIALPGSHVVECGCHHGLTTIALAGWVGKGGFVHAFDAVLDNAVIAKTNIEVNKIENVSILNAAIGGSFCIAQMYNDSNVIVVKTGASTPTSTVMVKLSSLFDTPPNALKLDIEGAELQVLESDNAFITAIPRLAIEVHTDLLPKGAVHSLLDTLVNRNLYVLWKEKELRPYAGEPIEERVHIFAW